MTCCHMFSLSYGKPYTSECAKLVCMYASETECAIVAPFIYMD